MNENEPVAWVHPELGGAVQFDRHFACAMQDKTEKIPLYVTPPTRQLSDEEIIDTWFKVAETNSIAERQILFARAIEAKLKGLEK
jgi:hypothetical protein